MTVPSEALAARRNRLRAFLIAVGIAIAVFALYAPTARFGFLAYDDAELLAEKVPFFLLALATVLLVLRGTTPLVPTATGLPYVYRGMNAVSSLLWYLGKTAWPSSLAVFYPHPAGHQSSAMALAGLLMLSAVTVALLRAGRPAPFLLAGWLWYLAALLPVLGFVQIGSYARSDRYAYLSQIGILVAIVWTAAELARQVPRLRPHLPPLLAIVIVGFGTASIRQTAFWRNDLTLFSRAVSVTEESYVAHANLGAALARDGRLEEAMRELRAAIRIAPEQPLVRENLGKALVAANRAGEAAEAFREVLRLDPGNSVILFRLGSALETVGRPAEAAGAYRAALAAAGGSEARRDRETGSSEAANGLGRTLASLGRTAEAGESFSRAVRLDPENLGARLNLGRILLIEERFPEARQELREVLRRDPGNHHARELLSRIP